MRYRWNDFKFGTFEDDYLTGSSMTDIVFGFGGNDLILTDAGNDWVFAGSGDDFVDAGAGNDRVFLGAGDDFAIGGLGDDKFYGGAGFDIVSYEGKVTDYQITSKTSFFGPRAEVKSLTDTVSDAGRDKLLGVEALYFAGDDYLLYLDGTNNVVLAGDDTAETGETGVLQIAGAALLANDQDFDGDTVSIASVAATSAKGAAVSFDGVNVSYDPGTLFEALKEGETTTDTFTYVADDGKGGTAMATVTVMITGSNTAPVLTANAAVNVDENTTAVAAAISATDVDSAMLTFSLSGADAALFSIDATNGTVQFINAPDFEAPGDVGADNVYNVTVSVQDDLGATASQDIAITVQDVAEFDGRINEIHYDNAGSDVGEFIEVRVAAGTDVTNALLELYNGSNGEVYASAALNTGDKTSDANFDYYVIDITDLGTTGIQNGSPDGMALSNGGTLIEFLSYEGTLTGVGGAADGAESTDIGVSETSATAVGASLQRNADGTWRGPEDETKGADNDAVPPLVARINEIHYDNDGADQGEFIEVRVEAGADVSSALLELYNGSNGTVYASAALSTGDKTSDANFDYYVLDITDLGTTGIQNGSPDGMALSNGGTLIEFLSYEGTMTGSGGAADGVESTDIGVAESSGTAVGLSLQRNADGTWREPETETKGASNDTTPELVARINEIHYDNAGSDVGEFIEVRVAAGADVSNALLELYNGSNGTVYASAALSTGDKTSDANFDYYVLDVADLGTSGIQNGGPDGMALSNAGSLIEFLSYEGTMTGAGGAADGVMSTDIGVAEDGGTLVGQSLQRTDGDNWDAPRAETKGADNAGDPPPPPEAKKISEIQGSGSESGLIGQVVTVSAVVTHVVSNGYYLQEEDADADADVTTSEGIFVFNPSNIGVAVGDQIEISGTVGEFFGTTQISSVTSEVINAQNVALPTAAEIMLSPSVAQDFEAVEGMRVSVSTGTPDPLTVITNFNLDRFGEITISAGIQTQATQLFDAQTQADEVAAHIEGNMNNRLLLDDGNGSQNPDEFQYLPGGAGDSGNGFLDASDNFGDAGTTLRLGSQITSDVQGVMNFGFGNYRLVVTEQLQIDEATNVGARTEAPADVGGSLQVASFNVLNFFSTIDVPGAGSGPNNLDPRGADTPEELARQTQKLVAGMTATEAEVFAVQEIENNGFGEGSAHDTLVDALNASVTDPNGPVYDFVDPTTDGGFIGTDAITTGIIYDKSAVNLIASDFIVFDEASAATTFALAQVLNAVVPSGDQVGDFQRNRPSVAATFEDKVTKEVFTVVSSHFKSKGDSNLQDLVDAAQSYLDGGGTDITQADIDALKADPNFDQGDGQGFWNQVRLDGSVELADWITTQYNGSGQPDGPLGVSNYLLLGDLNAYAKEDAVQYLDNDAGLVDLIDQFIGQDDAYSFAFDGQRGTLDQGFASSDLALNVTGTTEWHINADEPDLINYDQSFKNPNFFNDGVYASSDHDPLLIGLQFGATDEGLLS